MASADIVNELKVQFEKAFKETAQLQEEIKRVGDKADSYDKEKFEKMSIDAAKSLELAQELQRKIEAQEKSIKAVSGAMLRPEAHGSVLQSEDELKFKRAVNSYLRNGSAMPVDIVDSELQTYARSQVFGDDRKAVQFANQLVEGVDPYGGYWVRPDRSADIITRYFETSPIRQVANVITTTSNSVEYMIDDDELGGVKWVGEVDGPDPTPSPEIGLLVIPVNNATVEPKASRNFLADAGVDVENWIMNKAAAKLSRAENNKFVVGEGGIFPAGFLNAGKYPEWSVNTSGSTKGVYERDKLETITTVSAGAINLDDLTTIQSALLEPYQDNATWMMDRLTWAAIMKIKTTENRPLIAFDYMSDGRSQMRLLGKPVVMASDVPPIATGAFAVAYGDFREGYTIVDRQGIFIERDTVTAKPFVKFYTTKRVGGAVTSFDSIKRLKIQ